MRYPRVCYASAVLTKRSGPQPHVAFYMMDYLDGGDFIRWTFLSTSDVSSAYVRARYPRVFNMFPDMQYVVTSMVVFRSLQAVVLIFSLIAQHSAALSVQPFPVISSGFCQTMCTAFRKSRSTRCLPGKRMIISKSSHQSTHVHFCQCSGIMIDVCLISFSDYSLFP
jgi:hypothetical protein